MIKIKMYISMVLLILSLAISLCCCDKERLPQEGKEIKGITENKGMQSKKKGSFYKRVECYVK